ncbi:hypothetical protein [Aureispira anguillae]|uniref:Uncharacterized protein n=1 Tax=Aureispira anguillae TaxID=2864201 RepID=A0A915YBS4_9BACT|nr:hypothetical protein [Aureispira anguillae]BDS10175.1 hypothetical protein AsAng_0008830 [Aureispira anguillae]
MMENDSINWGLLLAIIGFWCCMELGMNLSLSGVDYPNALQHFRGIDLPIYMSCAHFF